MLRATFFPLALTALAALAGCGPSLAQIDPKEVVNVSVRPASGQLLYCPGDAFQVEVVAKLKDGTSCSNVDEKRGCKNESNMVIAPDLVKITGTGGAMVGDPEKFIFVPEKDFLKTADTGVALKAWLESATKGSAGKSMEGEVALKPVYDCQKDTVAAGAHGGNGGGNGGPGPVVNVAITTLSTPFYPDAALIRIDWGASRAYMISPSADKPVRIIAQGGHGGQGARGANGKDGQPGKDATEDCGVGGDGGNGLPGLAGGRGGDGGPGGTIKVTLDETHADKLRGRLLLDAPGGDAGAGGMGGMGGFGGKGGEAGKLKAGDASCKPAGGRMGDIGPAGQNGPMGARGPGGPAPTFENAPRNTVFASELSVIQRIEGAKAK